VADELDDPLVTELHGFEGSLFDPREMERLRAKLQQGLWMWAHSTYWDQQAEIAKRLSE
jgi:hypothetical protein